MKITNKNYRMSKPAKRILATIVDPTARNIMKKAIISAEVAEAEKARTIRVPTSDKGE